MNAVKSGVKTSSFQAIAGLFGVGGIAGIASPEHMKLFTAFLSAIPNGAYAVLAVYIFYRMKIEEAQITTAPKLTKKEVG